MDSYPFRSVFLDTCIVRYIATFPCLLSDEGDGDEEEERRLATLRPEHQRDVLTLGAMMSMLERGYPHDIVITPCVVRELPARAQPFGAELLNWCRTMGFVVSDCPHTFFDTVATVLDETDRHLYLEAAVNGCDTFLTTDYSTIVTRRDSLPATGPRVLTPSEWWRKMKPWAGLPR